MTTLEVATLAVALASRLVTKRHAPLGAAFKLGIRSYETGNVETDCADIGVDTDGTGDYARSDELHVVENL